MTHHVDCVTRFRKGLAITTGDSLYFDALCDPMTFNQRPVPPYKHQHGTPETHHCCWLMNEIFRYGLDVEVVRSWMSCLGYCAAIAA